MRLILITIFLEFIQCYTFCQQSDNKQFLTLRGNVRDGESNLPLPYASVGILNMPYGTVADSLGVYSFNIEQYSGNDSVQVNMVGYITKRIAILSLIKSVDKTIILIRKPETLNEVIVSNRKMKTEVIGRQSSSSFTQVSLHKKGAAQETVGSEFGARMFTGHPSATLKDFNWFISRNNFKSIKLRLNIYSVKDNYPDTLICTQQIFATLHAFQTGWNRIDLEGYNIRVTGDFIITLQWLEHVTENDKKPITLVPVAMGLFSRNGYMRLASQDKWKRVNIFPSFYATINY